VINLVSEKTIEERMLGTLADKKSLADGVLDRIGNLKEIKLRTGGQSFLARLQQVLTPADVATQPPAAPKKVLPADRPRGFALEAHRRINGALIRLEERYPQDAPHSVLYVVVERDAPQWRQQLAALHEEYFGPGQSDPLAPVQLEVIDRATDEALQRLIAAGLVASVTRASRPLFPEADGAAGAAPLSPVELEQAAAHRQQAHRKLKMALLLGQGDLAEEARGPLLEAVCLLGRAWAVENRLAEPKSAADVLLPPLALHWNEAHGVVRGFIGDAASPWQPAAEALKTRLEPCPTVAPAAP
jgi:hypothetical protein